MAATQKLAAQRVNPSSEGSNPTPVATSYTKITTDLDRFHDESDEEFASSQSQQAETISSSVIHDNANDTYLDAFGQPILLVQDLDDPYSKTTAHRHLLDSQMDQLAFFRPRSLYPVDEEPNDALDEAAPFNPLAAAMENL
ncbi:hypothetical protein AAF712_016820, partial [Marasmius tenuissimus]